MFTRLLTINLPKRQSIFLFGARKTGKSSFLKTLYPASVYYDLLDTRELSRLTRSPYLLREEVVALSVDALDQPIIIDEIQKIPALLNEIHWLIENTSAQFILCGSSARQLKTQSTNLLGGRAWGYHFYPLTWKEIPQFDLLKALQQGLIPSHYLASANFIDEYLQAYIDIYLTDEIRNEGVVRNLPGFSHFLEVAGMCNTELINTTNIARDCGVHRSTVQAYFQILVDTLIGYFIYPYTKKIKRDLISAMPKFYFFDVAVANFLAQQKMTDLKGAVAGKSFENYILMELIAQKNILRKRYDIAYWRTKTGLEVDFILGKAEVAIEVKISSEVHQSDLKGLIAFLEEHPDAKGIVVSQDARERLLQVTSKIQILIFPWQMFLKKLWDGEII